MSDDRTYIRVHDGMDEHPKVEPLSDAAFRLLLRSWFYCSRNRTDGRISDAIWRKRGTVKTRGELLTAGLAEQCDGHVQMHDYLEHQRSAEEIKLLQEVRGDSGSFGNHVRWHVVKRKPKKGCEHCFPPEEDTPGTVANGIANAIANGSQTDRKAVASTEAEAEAEAEVLSKTSLGGVTEVDASESTPPRFPDHCPDHADVEVPPKCGGCMKQKQANAAAAAAAAALPDYRLRVVPPLCGECDERWIETPDGLAKCPRCYPFDRKAAS